MRSLRIGGRVIIALGLVAWASVAFAQGPAGRGRGAGPAATRPASLFKEDWKLPPHEGPATDENTRVSPAVLTNTNLEATFYGPGASVVRAAEHEGRVDLWNGLASSPVAITLKDKRNYLDLTGLARLRWMVRTNAIHTLYPVIKLADGTLLAGDRAISTNGEFLEVEVAFTGMRWYRLDPAKVVVMTEVRDPNLTRVDEVGLVSLAPGGGHGTAGSFNLSTVEMFAKGVPR